MVKIPSSARTPHEVSEVVARLIVRRADVRCINKLAANVAHEIFALAGQADAGDACSRMPAPPN